MDVKLDYRGNPLYSSMISKLCSYNRRANLFLKYYRCNKENPEQQIIMLSHNKNLADLYIKQLNIDSAP